MIQCKDISVQEVINARDAFHEGKTSVMPLDALSEKYPPKVVYTKMMRLARKGILEYGVSVRGA